MGRIQICRWAAILPFAITCLAQTPDISLSLETETGRTQFSMGEAIGLTLTITAAAPHSWMVPIAGRDRSLLGFGHDRFIVSPADGTSDPQQYRLSGPMGFSGIGGSFPYGPVSTGHQDLNQWVRFSRPGVYRIHGQFHAMSPQRQDRVLETNEIAIEIVPADPQKQAAQLREDVAAATLTAVPPDSQAFEAHMNVARRIWYLDTPDSIREAARLLGTEDIQFSQILQTGLLGSTHRDVALAVMKQLLQSPDEPVTPIFLNTLAALEAPAKNAAGDYRESANISEGLRRELTERIDGKQGRAKAVSIKTLLDNLPDQSVPSNLRMAIAQLFSELPLLQQTELLNSEWKKIAGLEMIPALRRIYDAIPDASHPAPPLAAAAAERMYELDPAEGRALLLAEMRRPYPRLPFGTLAILPDRTLPELDQLWAEQMGGHGSGVLTELIARYATASVLPQAKTYYAARRAAMSVCDPPLIAYFLRVDPISGQRLLQEALAHRADERNRCWIGILGRTALYSVTPEWEKIAVGALGDPSVAVKSDAVKALGRYGSQMSEAPVWESFRYWHNLWKERPAEMNEENRQFEQVFLESIEHATSWAITSNDLAAARDLCATADCRARAEEYRREWKPNGS